MTETQKQFDELREYLKSPEFRELSEDERTEKMREYAALRQKLNEEKGQTS